MAAKKNSPKIGASFRWRNRIVGHGEVAPDQLMAHPLNWRIHSQFQQDALKGAISDIGFIRSVTVNQRTGHVIDGHLRVVLAMRNNEETIPVEYVDLDEREEAEALATLDPIAVLAVADNDILAKVLSEVQASDMALKTMLADLAAQNGLYGENGAGSGDVPEPQIDRVEELREK